MIKSGITGIFIVAICTNILSGMHEHDESDSV